MPRIVLTDDQLCLRRAGLREAGRLVKAVQSSQHELGRYLPWAERPYDLPEARAFLEFAREQERTGRGHHLSIFENASGELIGGIGLMLVRVFQSAELGYWIRTDRAGQGLMTRAGRLLLAHAFDELDLRRVCVHAETRNPASCRVAEKLGMRREGRLRSFMLHHGEPKDHYLYAILAAEFRPGFRG